MQYYPFVKKWAKIKPHLDNPKVQETLARDFNKFTLGRWGKRFEVGMLPSKFETCDWDMNRKGRKPTYWKYTKHAACHWLVNFNLVLAQLVEPNKQWRIVTSQGHSTVWDGEETLFDFNFCAFGIDADEAFEIANKKILPIGKELVVYTASKAV